MKETSKSSLTTQYIILFCVVLLIANMVLGFLLIHQSSSTIQSMIRKSMLNVSNTAAELVDGNTIASFTEKDVGSPAYNDILRKLSAFQNNADIEYIYTVRETDTDYYTFTIDADPEAPAKFGEAVVVTKALLAAGKGIPAVDDAPVQDRWGNYYSSFSPIFDSQGNVAGVVGVDFNALWYRMQVWKNTIFVVVISILFTMVGVSGFLMLNSRIRGRFTKLRAELATLSRDVDALTEEILSNADYQGKETPRPPVRRNEGTEGGDEIMALGRKIKEMHREMELYLDYMQARVNTDALTQVGNTTAYLERQKLMEGKDSGFTLVVFDIDNLKHVNDNYGHAWGDRIIRSAGSVIADSFGRENTYRIGGDEFIAIVEPPEAERVPEQLAALDQAIAAYNRTSPEKENLLSISRGRADFIPGRDNSFRDVFIRADQQMYEWKDSHRSASRD